MKYLLDTCVVSEPTKRIPNERVMQFADSQIAATALCHGMTLVTRNVRDMADFGVELFNPFDD